MMPGSTIRVDRLGALFSMDCLIPTKSVEEEAIVTLRHH